MLISNLATLVSGRLFGDDGVITRVMPLAGAGSGDVSFIIWPQDILVAKASQASLLITTSDIAADYADKLSSSLLITEDIYAAFVILVRLIQQGELKPAVHHAGLGVGLHTIIDPTAVVDKGVCIGQRCTIGPGVVIHPNVVIGDDCIIQAQTVIGSEAFAPFGLDNCKNLPSLGSVFIEDGVQIGALCTIDRGLIGATHIKSDALIDNMVHIGHDAQVGRNVVIAAQSGLAGFVTLGDFVTLGGQVGVVPFVKIGECARISGKSLVHCDIKHHEIWSGNPSMPHGIYLRAYAYMKRMFRQNAR